MVDKKELVIGILGLLLIISAFLGFPSSIQRIFMVLSGVVISFISFWKIISKSVAKITEEEPRENEKVF